VTGVDGGYPRVFDRWEECCVIKCYSVCNEGDGGMTTFYLVDEHRISMQAQSWRIGGGVIGVLGGRLESDGGWDELS
jgi:hypothetical protein